MDTARCMLRLYGYWLAHSKADKKKRVELAARDYLKWGTEWDEKIRTKGWKRPRPYLPNCFKVYGEYLHLRDTGKLTLQGRKHGFEYDKLSGGSPLLTGQKSVVRIVNAKGQGTNAEVARGMVVVYIKKARKIAASVGKGQFPGKY